MFSWSVKYIYILIIFKVGNLDLELNLGLFINIEKKKYVKVFKMIEYRVNW